MTLQIPRASRPVLVAVTRSTLARLLDRDGAAALSWVAERLDAVADAVILGVDLVDPDGGDGAGVDPSIAAITLAHHTRRVGLVVAAAPQRDHPYNLARRIATIDHASAGRAGLLIGGRDDRAAVGSPWTDADPSTAAADAVVAIRELWRSFPVDAIVGDRRSGVFAESHRIVAVDHRGAFDVAGPLQVPWSPQVWPPVLAWSGGSATPLASVADLVVGPAEPGVVLHQVAEAAELTDLLAGAPELAPVGSRLLRARLRLAPADPPTHGRQVFPDPAPAPGPRNGTDRGRPTRELKEVSHVH